MSPEEIAASALAGMESSLSASPSKLYDKSGKADETPGVHNVNATAVSLSNTPLDVHSAQPSVVSKVDVIHDDSAVTTKRDETVTDINSSSVTSVNKAKRRGPKPKVKLPIEPRLIQTIPKRKEYVNHTYSDYSTVPIDPSYVAPTKIADMSFTEKVHDILSKAEYEPWISWKAHGRAFGITVPTMFEKTICEKYFGHKRYSSFLRQINNHGFKHLTKDGPDRNCYYHESFLRGMIHLCKYMPEPKDARRQIPDPDNEPDFDSISRLYPLPQGASIPLTLPTLQFNIPSNMNLSTNNTTSTQEKITNSAIAQVPPLVNMGAPPMVPTTPSQQSQSNVVVTEPFPGSTTVNAQQHIPNATPSNLGTTQPPSKNCMDRIAALSEIHSLSAQLTTEIYQSPTESPDNASMGAHITFNSKRKVIDGNNTMVDTSVVAPKKQFRRMPQRYPTLTKKGGTFSQLQSILEKRTESELQQHQQQAKVDHTQQARSQWLPNSLQSKQQNGLLHQGPIGVSSFPSQHPSVQLNSDYTTNHVSNNPNLQLFHRQPNQDLSSSSLSAFPHATNLNLMQQQQSATKASVQQHRSLQHHIPVLRHSITNLQQQQQQQSQGLSSTGRVFTLNRQFDS